MPDAHSPHPPASSRTRERRGDDDLFNPDTLSDAEPDDPADRLDIPSPDFRNPMSDDAPLAQDTRVQWLEERGYDPKVDADLKRHNGEGVVLNGEFIGALEPGEMDLIRDGIEHDECPDLPRIPASFDMKPRWESFCRLYAFGHSAADAARHAGYAWSTSRHAGWRLLQDPRIRRRIRTLQEFTHENRPQCREDLSVRLETVYREAMNRGQYHAAVRSLEAIAKMEGLRPPPEPEKIGDEKAAPDGSS